MVENIKEFKDALHQGEVEFVYNKKNGEERTALGTLKMDIIGEENMPKGTGREKPNNVICYYDLNSEGWRSFVEDNLIMWKIK